MLISDRRNHLGDDIIEALVELWGNGIRHGMDGTDAEGSCFTVRIIVMSFIIHISTRIVSFSILIGQNSVAEWLSG